MGVTIDLGDKPDFDSGWQSGVGPDDWEPVLTLIMGVRHDRVISFAVKALNGDLGGLKIQRKAHERSDWSDFLYDEHFESSSIDHMLFASVPGPHQVSDGEQGDADIDVNSSYAIRFLARQAWDLGSSSSSSLAPAETVRVRILGQIGAN